VVGKPGLPVVFETIGVAAPYATLDGAVSNVTMSNGNLTATHINATNNSGTRSTALKTSGKYYFEVVLTTFAATASNTVGIILSSGTYTQMVSSGLASTVYNPGTGGIFSNGAFSTRTLGAAVAGDLIGIAIDLDGRKGWFRKNGGNWNGQPIGVENPATGLGIVVIASGSYAPVLGFGVQANDVTTANLGGSAFVGAVPAGFTSGWPA